MFYVNYFILVVAVKPATLCSFLWKPLLLFRISLSSWVMWLKDQAFFTLSRTLLQRNKFLRGTLCTILFSPVAGQQGGRFVVSS